ncbi:MAG TPA: hypothetical protein VFV85_09260, partial [Conexibacter sp.]|nr:hypothetical protein [Conexibacter sp.]
RDIARFRGDRPGERERLAEHARSIAEILGHSVSAEALGDALAGVAGRASLRAQLAAGGVEAVRDRSWERALGQLADGYARALAGAAGGDADAAVTAA